MENKTAKEVLSFDNPNREANFKEVLAARLQGLSWEMAEAAVGLKPRNGMNAWDVINKAPVDLNAKFAAEISKAKARLPKAKKEAPLTAPEVALAVNEHLFGKEVPAAATPKPEMVAVAAA